jgi:hypothetical protein
MRFFPLVFSLLFLAACDKFEPVPVVTPIDFVLNVQNDLNELQAHFTVVLSDENGDIVAFREIPGDDTARVVVPDVGPDAQFNCTVAKVVILTAPGSGVKDTSITLQTYTNLSSGASIELRNHFYRRQTDVRIQFTQVSTIDSVMVSEGVTIARPQSNNQFSSHYQVYHTGSFWLRVMINGEGKWRFMKFDNIDTDEITASIDATLLPVIFATPKKIQLPYTTAWKYNLEGVMDLNKPQLYPLGDFLRAPGGQIPVYNEITAYEPIMNDIFNPEPKPYTGFRLQLNGVGSSPTGFYYQCDRVFSEIPSNISLPDFDAAVLSISNDRYAAVTCSGDFDVLTLQFSKGNVQWEVYLRPNTSSTVTYRLPELPAHLSNLTNTLKQYSFGKSILARAESFEQLVGYSAVIDRYMKNDDPLWRAKADYTAKGKF